MSRRDQQPTSLRKNLIPLKMDVSMQFTDSIRKWVASKVSSQDISSRLIKYGDKIALEDDKRDEQIWSYLISDFLNSGFKIVVGFRKDLKLQPPKKLNISKSKAKDNIKEKMLINRNEILNQHPVQDFFYKMHKEKFVNNKNVSITSLIDDGNDLVNSINEIIKDMNENDPIEKNINKIKSIIHPKIQFVTDKSVDEFTGLLLGDIWRYFRYTWSMPFKGQLGRSVWFLVRNKARTNHPIMGIGSLANPVLNLTARDLVIGWKPLTVIVRIIEDPSQWKKYKKTFIKILENYKKIIKSDDLIPKNLNKEFNDNSLKVEKLLEKKAEKARKERIEKLKKYEAERKNAENFAEEPPKDPYNKQMWSKKSIEEKSLDPLFVRKRANHLIRIIKTLRELSEIPVDAKNFIHKTYDIEIVKEKTEYAFCEKTKQYKKLKYGDKKIVLNSNEINSTLSRATQEIRSEGLASYVLDLNVCGAVLPYRDLLVGKLVALSAGSKEISEEYFNKYKDAVSEISSNVMGKKIIRKPVIKAVTTTSLYSINPSQYNRLKVKVGDKNEFLLNWDCAGMSRGMGTLQFSNRTTKLLSKYSQDVDQFKNINGVFGEGTSPLLRKMRQGFGDIPQNSLSDDGMRHDNSRIVYILKMYPEALEDLIMNQERTFHIPNFEQITDAWISRWLFQRIQKPDILNNIKNKNYITVKNELGLIDKKFKIIKCS